MKRLGKFQLLERLGLGAFGAVWKARDTELDRIVALKIPHNGLLTAAEERERFQREARAAAQLRHPNIVTVYEVAALEGLPAIVSEFAPGISLQDLLEARRLTFPQTAALIVQLADALEYAHSLGVVHRDVKPANVMLLREPESENFASKPASELAEIGKPMLLDFGLALRDAGETTMTVDGHILGTPAYLSPEQAAGRSHRADRRSDVYSLGVVMYQLLTGELPFRGSKLTLLDQVLHQEPNTPRTIDSKVPRDLETICLKCLRKEAGNRYPTALELAEDIRRFQRGEPVQARQIGRPERCWRWCRRNPRLAALFASVAALLLVIAIGSSVGMVQFRLALLESEVNRDRAVGAENDARDKLWGAYLSQAQALRMSQRRGQCFDSLQAIREALALPLPAGRSLDELRNEAAAALALPDVQVVSELIVPPTPWIALDGDLRCYATSDALGNVCVRRVADNGEIARFPRAENKIEPILSPNGQMLALRDTRTNRLEVWRLGEKAPELIYEQANVAQSATCFSPDSQLLAYSKVDGFIRLVTLGKPQVTSGWQEKEPSPTGTSFSPDSRSLLYWTRVDLSGTIHVRDVLTGNVKARLPHPHLVNSVAWHPTGQLIATCCDDHQIRLWDPATGQLMRTLPGHKNLGVQCVFSPEGDRLLSIDSSHLLRIWDVHSGRQLFSTHPEGCSFPASCRSPDGRLVIAGDYDAQVLRVVGGNEFRALARQSATGRDPYANVHTGIALSHDGRFLAIKTEEGVCALINPVTGAELAVIRGQPTIPFAFESSGALLTRGSRGLCRWPVSTNVEKAGIRIGPPEPISPLTIEENYGASADGHVLAIPNYKRGAQLLRRDRSWAPIYLEPQEDVRTCAVSPDGRWVATGNHDNTHGMGAKVWDATDGHLVKELPMDTSCWVAFSPDGKWLLTLGHECELRQVGVWEKERTLGKGNGFVFTRDSRMVAIGGNAGTVRLVDPANGRDYVRLDAPQQTNIQPFSFTPDGSQLIAFSSDSQMLCIWDMRAIRRGLKALNLDWDAPEYPPEPPLSKTPLLIEVMQ